MKKILVSLVLLVLLTGAALADTLYLKNGSVLKGTFIGFENGEFIFEISNGNRVKFRAAEVSRLTIDSDRRDPRDENYPRRDPVGTPPSTGGTTGGRWENATPFDVQLRDQWIRSQVQVAAGQRVRVDASGTVTLEGRSQVTPDGLRDRRDPDAPMPNENDGALIAAIGQDQNSPAIFIGRSREFVADRAGILYFTVNHWETRDARGAFRVNVSVDRSSTGTTTGGAGRPTQGREKTITVLATQAWTDTGIDLEPNMTIEFVAEGTIQIGNRRSSTPNGDRGANISTSSYPMQNEGVGALIAKIRYRDGRDSNFLFVGANGSGNTEPNESGRLYLGINDDYFRDNTGSYRVTIRW
ncbi:MAG: hypothetical protein SF339_03245 [Blastocatellia bacterium]|nr:hypothetical protein [Blastocatellia bacterium]